MTQTAQAHVVGCQAMRPAQAVAMAKLSLCCDHTGRWRCRAASCHPGLSLKPRTVSRGHSCPVNEDTRSGMVGLGPRPQYRQD